MGAFMLFLLTYLLKLKAREKRASGEVARPYSFVFQTVMTGEHDLFRAAHEIFFFGFFVRGADRSCATTFVEVLRVRNSNARARYGAVADYAVRRRRDLSRKEK